MRDKVIVFERVTKTYPYYGYLTAGLKNFLVNLPKTLNQSKKRFTALKNVSFEVLRGECLGVIGRNGAGKSTLLGLIAGVLKPDKGKIEIKGRISPLLELGAGFHPELTGRENAVLNGVLMGMTMKETLEKVPQIIEFSELENFIDQPLRTYSSGMVARLAFSVVAHLNSDILLIDEILAVGDINFQKKCLMKLESFLRDGITIIFVSHSMDQIKTLCNRVMWIEDHSVKLIGETQETCKAYEEFLYRSVSTT